MTVPGVTTKLPRAKIAKRRSERTEWNCNGYVPSVTWLFVTWLLSAQAATHADH